MAQIARRTFAQMLTEVTNFAGGHDYSGFSTRAQHAIWAAYLDLSLTYHHFELEANTTLTLPATTKQVDLPADCYAVIAVVATIGGTDILINPRRTQFALADRWATSGETKLPSEWARYGRTLFFNGPSSGSTELRIYYYRVPTAPDFDGSAYPETNVLWDDHIIEASVAKLQRRIWRPDLAQANLEFLKQWLGEQIQPTLQQPIVTLPDMTTASRPLGGAQG